MLNALFNPENKFWMFIAKVMDLLILELFWLICCIPIITVGASTAAFWKMLVLCAKDQEGRVVHDFFVAFKKSFPTATLVWLTQCAVFLFFGFDIYVCLSMTRAGQYPQVMMFVLGVLGVVFAGVLLICLWLYPLAGVYNHFGFKKVLKNSVFLTLRHFAHTLSCFTLLAASFWVCYHFPKLLPILPLLICYLCAKVMAWIFRNYPNPSDTSL